MKKITVANAVNIIRDTFDTTEDYAQQVVESIADADKKEKDLQSGNESDEEKRQRRFVMVSMETNSKTMDQTAFLLECLPVDGKEWGEDEVEDVLEKLFNAFAEKYPKRAARVKTLADFLDEVPKKLAAERGIKVITRDAVVVKTLATKDWGKTAISNMLR